MKTALLEKIVNFFNGKTMLLSGLTALILLLGVGIFTSGASEVATAMTGNQSASFTGKTIILAYDQEACAQWKQSIEERKKNCYTLPSNEAIAECLRQVEADIDRYNRQCNM
ncbi:MAG TPA: hypothetical protein VMU29_13970 [Smithella sp.]|nr:hypothetical protein [Smithella sp.]